MSFSAFQTILVNFDRDENIFIERTMDKQGYNMHYTYKYMNGTSDFLGGGGQ